MYYKFYKECVMTDLGNYSVKIEGNGLSLDREVPKEIGDKIVVLVLTGGQQSFQPTNQHQNNQQNLVQPTAPLLASDSPINGNQELSLREFLDSCQAKRNPDKITAIGYYNKTYLKADVFTRDDIIAGFESAAELVPKNPSRDIKWTLKSGWIAIKQGTKDKYYVTNTGTQAVEGKFPKDMLKRTRGTITTSKRNSKKVDTE